MSSDEPMSEIEIEDQLELEAFPEKAQLVILQNCTVPLGSGLADLTYTKDEVITVQFNPTEYSIAVYSNLQQSTEETVIKPMSTAKVKKAQPNSLSVKFLFDAAIQMDSIVRSTKALKNSFTKFHTDGDLNSTCLKKCRGLTQRTKETNRPPLLCFSYGSTCFVGYATSVTIQYTRFDKMGKVLRAEVSLQIEETPDTLPSDLSIPKEKKSEWKSNDNAPVEFKDFFTDKK